MKSLQESLLDNEEELLDTTEGKKIIKEKALKYFNDNYSYRFGDVKFNEETGELILVNCEYTDIRIKNRYIKSLTGGFFKFGKMPYANFFCKSCPNLKNLEGSPEECDEFAISFCNNLTSLKGGPKKTGYVFDCSYCTSLKTLEGAPEECDNFDCSHCTRLKSLKGAPKKVNQFFCDHTGFTEKDVKAVSKVADSISCS